MKLSDAIVLGSSVVKPQRSTLLVDWYDGKRGCALGMACEAEGIKVGRDAKSQSSLGLIFKRWPWTFKREIANDEVCCYELPQANAAMFIAHIFDHHIMTSSPAGGKVWTLEQLLDWIRANEPAEVELGASETNGEHAEVLDGAADLIEHTHGLTPYTDTLKKSATIAGKESKL
jgi:hypothetical protein